MATFTRRSVLGMAASTVALAGRPAYALDPLKVCVFPGISNLPLFAAQDQGYFRKNGVAVDIVNTVNSDDLREGLAEGRHQIAHSGVDNAIAMAVVAKADVAVVVGGHGGFGRLIAQSDVDTIASLRGRNVLVDAPNTAYALVLYKILQDHGLRRGDYTVIAAGGTASVLAALLKDRSNAAAIVSPPFAFRAVREGLKDFGPVKDAIGAYQFDAGFVMRPWADAHRDVLVRYLAAYIEGCRWALSPANRAPAISLMLGRLKLAPPDAERLYELIVDPKQGIAPDARLDMNGFSNTLKLRAEIEGQWGGTPPPAERFVDNTYYEQAVARLGRIP
jgi:ABC-type nitrate/sulfonate/bicarbonate transport system substrate-binding protein